jgi:hypothetical protein
MPIAGLAAGDRHRGLVRQGLAGGCPPARPGCGGRAPPARGCVVRWGCLGAPASAAPAHRVRSSPGWPAVRGRWRLRHHAGVRARRHPGRAGGESVAVPGAVPAAGAAHPGPGRAPQRPGVCRGCLRIPRRSRGAKGCNPSAPGRKTATPTIGPALGRGVACGYFDSRRMVSSRPLSDKGNMRLPMSCWMMLMLWRYSHTPCGSGLTQA